MRAHLAAAQQAALLVALPVTSLSGAWLLLDGAAVLARPLGGGPAALSSAVAAGAAVGTGALLLWLSLAAAVTAADALTRRTGRAVAWLGASSRAVAPAGLRRLVVTVLAAGVATSAALPAQAATPAPPATALPGGAVDPGWAPFTPPTEAGTEAPAPEQAAPATAWAADPPPALTRAAPAEPGPLVTTPRPRVAVEDAVVVRRGDTLWDIAARHLPAGATDAEIAVEWPRWYAENRSRIGPDPDLLLPGTRLAAPGASS